MTTCAPDRAPDHGGWYTYPVTLTLNATDSGSGVAKTFYSFDGATWEEYTTPPVVDDPGATSVWYYSEDAAGNTGATAGPCSVKLDLADPEPYLSGVAAVAMVDVRLHNAAGVTPVASGQTHVVWENGTPSISSTPRPSRDRRARSGCASRSMTA